MYFFGCFFLQKWKISTAYKKLFVRSYFNFTGNLHDYFFDQQGDMMNHFIGIGRLTGGAETKYTSNGTACVKFSICINRVWKDKNGDRQEKPNFFNCVIWGKYGESMGKYLTKGKQIGIEAELEQNTWMDSNGNNHSAVQLTVNEIVLLASPRNDSGPADNGAAPPPKKKTPDADDTPF
jgi:single-strand DNA-binding protein